MTRATRASLPRTATRLLRLTLPKDWADSILRDLEEIEANRPVGSNRLGHWLWCWGEALSFSLRFTLDRFRSRIAKGSPRRRPLAGWLAAPEVKLAARSILKTPGLSALSVLSLALGIGIVTTAFAILNAFFFSFLPLPDGERIVLLRDFNQQGRYDEPLEAGEFHRRASQMTLFDEIGAYRSRSLSFATTTGQRPVSYRAPFHTPNLLRLGRVAPLIGRWTEESDAMSAATPVIVLSEGLWRRHFASDPSVLGRDVLAGGGLRTVIGVMPSDFRFPADSQLWIPIQTDPSPGNSDPHLLQAVGRLAPGVTLEQASAEWRAMSWSQIEDETRLSHLVVPFTRGTADPELFLYLLAIIGGLLLLVLVAAANLSSLFLARNSSRSVEIALRSALGASRGRIVWQLLLETLAITMAASLLALVGTRQALTWLTEAMGDEVPYWASLELDPLVLLFTLVAAMLAGVTSGLYPALRSSRAEVNSVLKEGIAGGQSFGRLGAVLIAGEMAVSVGFLGAAATVSGGIWVREVRGFSLPMDEVLVAQLYFGQPQPGDGSEGMSKRQVWDRFLEECDRKRRELERGLAALPNLRAVSASSDFPGNPPSPVRIEFEPEGDAPGRASGSRSIAVGPGYWDTLDLEFDSGRDFLPSEFQAPSQSGGAIVNAPFVQRHFGGRNPLGRRFRILEEDRSSGRIRPAPWLEVVGVVPEAAVNLTAPRRSDAFYLPLQPTNVLRLGLRVEGDLPAMLPELHRVVESVDPEIQVQWAVSLEEQMREPVSLFRGLATCFLCLGLLAIVLSTAGLYALTSFYVASRRRELGIRRALGASSRAVLKEVLRSTSRHILTGAATGVILAWSLSGLIATIPYELDFPSPATTPLIALLLSLIALSASLAPARRALRLEPLEVLRRQ